MVDSLSTSHMNDPGYHGDSDMLLLVKAEHSSREVIVSAFHCLLRGGQPSVVTNTSSTQTLAVLKVLFALPALLVKAQSDWNVPTQTFRGAFFNWILSPLRQLGPLGDALIWIRHVLYNQSFVAIYLELCAWPPDKVSPTWTLFWSPPTPERNICLFGC